MDILTIFFFFFFLSMCVCVCFSLLLIFVGNVGPCLANTYTEQSSGLLILEIVKSDDVI
jgi:hypothetical protein